MAWCPASGISITGATRPNASYISAPMSAVTRPFSDRSSASRQRTCGRYGSALARMLPASANWAKMPRSNFHCQPPSTGCIDRRATWSIT